MPALNKPPLTEGAHKSLNTLLHSLHLKAGHPSCRQLEKEIGQAGISRSTIHDAFSSLRLPALDVVMALVDHLTDKAPMANPKRAKVNRRLVYDMWVRAAQWLSDEADRGELGTRQGNAGASSMQLAQESSLVNSIYVTVDEAAILLGVPKQAVYRMVHAGELAAIRVGRLYRIPAREVWRAERVLGIGSVEP
jgi:excisionase family DNA binding protein